MKKLSGMYYIHRYTSLELPITHEHTFFFREFNQSYRIDAKNWIRQVESLADQFDYTLLMECSENYVCQVKKMAVVDHLVRFAKKK